MGLLCIHSNDSERVWKTEDLAFGEAVCGDDYGGGCEEHSLVGVNEWLEVPVILSGFLERVKVG